MMELATMLEVKYKFKGQNDTNHHNKTFNERTEIRERRGFVIPIGCLSFMLKNMLLG